MLSNPSSSSVAATQVNEANKLFMPPTDPKHINLAGCFTMDCGGFINALFHDVDGSLTGMGAGASVIARAEALSAIRSNGHPTPYRIPAKLLSDPWPSDRRRRLLEEEVRSAVEMVVDANMSGGRLTAEHGAELISMTQGTESEEEEALLGPLGTSRRRLQGMEAAQYVKPCDPTMAMYDPQCRARMRTPMEVAYQGYGIFRGAYSAAAVVSNAGGSALSRCIGKYVSDDGLSGWNAWLCSKTVLEPARLIIEDEDESNFDKGVGPVALQSGGYVNLMNGGKSYDYLKRRNTFLTTVALDREYDIAYFATNPEALHYQLPNRLESERVRIGCFYSNPQRLIVTWKGKYKRDMNPSGYDFGNVVRPTPSDPCGSNTYVGWENKLYFTLCGTMAGDKGVQIRTLPVIRLAITSTQLVDVGLDEFFDAPGQMTTNIGELRSF